MGVKNKRSGKVLLQILAGLLLFLFLAESALAVPGKLNFQGALTNADGSRLSDGHYSITFSLYDVLTGGNFTWTEDHNLVVQNGVFSVELGSTNAIDASIFAGDCYLGITIAGEDEMTPRQQILSVGYAFQADNLGGQPASVYVQQGTTSVVTSAMITDGSITAIDIATNAIGTSELVDGSVTVAKLADASYFATQTDLTTALNIIATLQSQIAALESKLAGIERINPNLIRFVDMNVQIINGTGSTYGDTNGTGNLIVGYNQNSESKSRIGSHNIVVGDEHSYRSFGGVVAGYNNTISGPWASVSGGAYNTASGEAASISGGSNGLSSGRWDSVSGGYSNTASGQQSTVCGGTHNSAEYQYSSISGGGFNSASGMASAVSGGFSNSATNNYSSVTAGNENVANGEFSCVSGGSRNIAHGYISSASGGLDNNVTGSLASISGGQENTASGGYSHISGGRDNLTLGSNSSISGGGGPHPYGNVAIANYSSISGGSWNMTGDYFCKKVHNDQTGLWDLDCLNEEFHPDPSPDITIGPTSTVSGGFKNIAAGHLSSIGGGGANFTTGRESSIIGGYNNHASGERATVAGGATNSAIDNVSTVSGYMSVEVLEVRGL